MNLYRPLLVAVGLLVAVAAATAQEPLLRRPVSADFSTLLNHKTDVPVAFAYQGRDAITIIDFPTLRQQGRMFNRLVALIERIGAPRERVLNNEELAGFIKALGKSEATFAYGNDFMVAELVVFFNLAELGNIELTPEEISLREHLLERRLMVVRNGFYQAARPSAVILSLSQVRAAAPDSPPVSELARLTIFAHELSHAEYYTNPGYAQFCRQFWRQQMSESQRAAFRNFLARGGYNPDKEEMMINETQAYLLHTPDPRAFSSRMVGLPPQEIEALRQAFRAAYPDLSYPDVSLAK